MKDGRWHEADEATNLNLVAFGSCRKQKRAQPIWESIARLKPDAYFWLGDAVYGKSPASPDDLLEYYTTATTAEAPLRDTVSIIDGVYDDHDYGENDAGKHYRYRDDARRLFLDYVQEPASSPRRTQTGGLYGTRTFGATPHQIKLIMLDTRYGRDDHLVRSPGSSKWLPKPGYIAAAVRGLCATLGVGRDFDGDVLGSEAQWRWLERELTNSTAAAHLIISSVQVLTSSPIVESWGHFPRSKRRLLQLLADARPAGALLLSGDVHYAELIGSRIEDSEAPGAGVLEVTASGLTHSCGDSYVGKVLCGTTLRLFGGHRYVQEAPSAASEDAPPAGWMQPGASLGARNFGTIAFEWGTPFESPPHMLVRIHDEDGTPRLTHTQPLGLSPELEAARWRRALAMPDIFEGAGVLRATLAWVLLLAGLVATVGLKFVTASSTRRAGARARRLEKKGRRGRKVD